MSIGARECTVHLLTTVTSPPQCALVSPSPEAPTSSASTSSPSSASSSSSGSLRQLSVPPSVSSSVAFSSLLSCCCLRPANRVPHLRPLTSFMAITANVVSSEVWEQNKKYTVYKIVVKYDSHTWIIHRRYNEFSKLCDLVRLPLFISLLASSHSVANPFPYLFCSSRSSIRICT